MLRMLSTPKTSVSPTATMNSQDASITPSMTMVAASSTGRACRYGQRDKWSLALRPGEAFADPLLRLHVGGRIDAFRDEVLDVHQLHRLCLGIPLGPPDRVRLDRLMAVAQCHFDMA